MKVLSLFDGISCGYLAFQRAGINVSHYYASEIDKYAIQIARKNFANTVHLGCVTEVRKMVENGLIVDVDYLIGGSPCQGFSLAGKQLAFDDPRSILFFEFVKILKILQKSNPNIKFLLENVKMKKQHLDVISEHLGVEPVCINSNLLSGQNRVRYYWCNWKVEQPPNTEISLKDIIENGATERSKSYCITASIGRTTTREYLEKNQGQLVFANKSYALDASYYKGSSKGSSLYFEKSRRELVFADMKLSEGFKWCEKYKIFYRMLTPIECERLQTLPDNYTNGVSNTQRYKMLGNGWTVDVIAHILKGSIK